MNRKMSLLGLFFCLVFGVHASPVLITTMGTFSANTPTRAWAAAGANWSVSFSLDSNPTVTSFSPGIDFEAPVTNFVYNLNGAVVDVGPVEVEFFSASQGGLFNLCFYSCTDGADNPLRGIGLGGGAVYTGTEDAPTIQGGTYAENFTAAYVGGTEGGHVQINQPNGAVTITTATAAPEPSSFFPILALCGFLILNTTFSKSKTTKENAA
jgi:hypothetical protein